jgi:hypothetical protein
MHVHTHAFVAQVVAISGTPPPLLPSLRLVPSPLIRNNSCQGQAKPCLSRLVLALVLLYPVLLCSALLCPSLSCSALSWIVLFSMAVIFSYRGTHGLHFFPMPEACAKAPEAHPYLFPVPNLARSSLCRYGNENPVVTR